MSKHLKNCFRWWSYHTINTANIPANWKKTGRIKIGMTVGKTEGKVQLERTVEGSMAGRWCRCSLLWTPPDSSQRVPSNSYPDTFSIAFDAWSQYGPLPIGSCVDAPDKKKNHIPPKNTGSLDVFVGAIVGNRDKGAIPWVYVSESVLRIRAIGVRVHS